MEDVQHSLFTVFEQFPERGEAIRSLIVQNEKFKTICEDYLTCLEAFRYWERSEGRDAKNRRKEYGALLKELEDEILQNLDKKRVNIFEAKPLTRNVVIVS